MVKLPTSGNFSASQKGFAAPILVIIFLIIVAIAGTGYYLYSKSSEDIKSFNILPKARTPHESLEDALNKTISVKTAYVDFKTKVTSRITLISAGGVTQTTVANIDGYITGSTNGEISKMEMRISSEEDSSKSINVEVISVKGGDSYVKGPATGTKWQKLSKAESDSLNDKNPTDASLYAFNMLGSVFSESKALFKTINKDTIEKLPDITEQGKTYSKYVVDISVTDFVSALGKDPDITEKDIKDAKAILGDATIRATFTVDNKSGFVTKLVLDGKNLTQIQTEATAAYGSAKHDFEQTSDFSRFDVPTGITVPEDKDVLDTTRET